MSLLYTDGFEEQELARDWYIPSYSPTISFPAGRLAGKSVALPNNGFGGPGVCWRGFPEISSLFLGVAINCGARSAGLGGQPQYIYLQADGGATTHLCIGINPSGHLIAVRGNDMSGTLLGTGTTALVVGTWYYVEINATINATTGVVQVKLNGSTEINFTGNTKNGGTAVTFDQIRLNGDGYAVGGNAYSTSYDDLYVCDANGTVNNTFLGDCQVQTLEPAGNGAANSWVNDAATSTNNYSHVNEQPVSTANYVQSSTVSQVDEYTIGAVTGTPTVYGVMVRAVAQKTDSGTRSLGLVARPTTTDHMGTAHPLTTGWGVVSDILETNPDSSTAWTAAALSASQFGVEVAA